MKGVRMERCFVAWGVLSKDEWIVSRKRSRVYLELDICVTGSIQGGGGWGGRWFTFGEKRSWGGLDEKDNKK